MARKRMGAHGSINEFNDGKMRMTIRPEPRIYTALQIAERIGSYIEVLHDPSTWHPEGEEMGMSYRDAMEKIRSEKMTQKYVIKILNDIWYMANYEECSDSTISIDCQQYESHQAMLDWVLMTFPKLNRTEEE